MTKKTGTTCNLSDGSRVGAGETMTASDPSRTRADCVEDLAQRILDSGPRIRSFLRRLSGQSPGRNSHDIDDLLQDVMERSIRYRHAFDPAAGSLESWMLKTAFRTFLDHRYRAARQPPTLGDDLSLVGAPVADVAELRDQLGFLLRQLTPVEQDIVLRFHHRRETIVEIAQALGMPTGTVKSHLHRARRKIAKGGS